MRGLSQGSDSGNFQTKVIHEAAGARSRDTSVTGKAVAALVKAMDSRSFSDRSFGYTMSLVDSSIQRVLINSMYHYFRTLAERADGQFWRDDQERMNVLDGKIIFEAMRSLNPDE